MLPFTPSHKGPLFVSTGVIGVAFTVTFNVAPVPTNVPPQLPLYHLQVAPEPKVPPVIPKVTDPGPQNAVAVDVAAVGATDGALIVTDVVAVTTPHPPAAAKV